MARVDLQSKVSSRIKALKAYHVDTLDADIKLHANENSHPIDPTLVDQFKARIPDMPLNRYPDPDCAGLKAIIAERLKLDPAQLVVGNGSDELIQILIQIFCDPGDALAVPDPTFAMYNIIAKGMGVRPVSFPLDENWDLKAEPFLEAIENQSVRILFFSYPNNPTGNCFDAGELQKIIDKFNGIVVLDEAYYDFARTSFVDQLAEHNNLIVLRSLSKIGLAGLRVGYGIAAPEIIQEVNKVRLPYNSNMVSQVFSEMVLSQFNLVEQQIDKVIVERLRLMTALEAMNDVTPFKSDSNFILFKTSSESGTIFKGLADRSILIRDLGAHPRLKNCLRVTVGTPEENSRFLEELEGVMRSA